jgi:predicted dehydrogenase
MALSVAECDQMIAACAESRVRLGIAYYRHFYPVVERVRTILNSGEIGTAIVAQMNAFEWFDPEPSHPRRWLLQKELSGGGPMFDFGCHRIEVLLALFGDVKEVRGLAAQVLFDRQVEDTASALLQFENGPQAVLTVTHAARQPQDTLQIFGSAGSIQIAVLNEGKLKVITSDGERVEVHPPHANFHQPLIDDFANAVLGHREPAVGGGIGRDVASVTELIYSAE